MDGTTCQRLTSASGAMDRTGTILRAALAGREVESVTWHMLDLQDTAFFVTRGDPTTYQPGPDVWPWLMGDPDAAAEVAPRTGSTLEGIRAAVRDGHGPAMREVTLVMSDTYELLLLAYDGYVLWDPGAPAG